MEDPGFQSSSNSFDRFIPKYVRQPAASIYLLELYGTDFTPFEQIFPGGHLPSITRVIEAIQKGGNSRFDIDAVTNHGSHYAKTLRMWRENFEANWEDEIAAALQARYVMLSKDDL